MTLAPLLISGDAGDVTIDLVCSFTVEENISAVYRFDWTFNNAPINESDGRINVRLLSLNTFILNSRDYYYYPQNVVHVACMLHV